MKKFKLTLLSSLLLSAHFAISGEIHRAARSGDVAKVSSFLNVGIDPDLLEKDGSTPLHLASFYGKLEVASLLIQKGQRSMFRIKMELHLSIGQAVVGN